MDSILDLYSPSVVSAMEILLKDRATGGNIIFATNEYEGIDFNTPITKNWLYSSDNSPVKPRVLKCLDAQSSRTRKRAEVFTPSWICNKMNNYIDAEWFGREDVFTRENGTAWEPVDEKIVFPENKTWKDYVLQTGLEITCGEAPYLVSRYDASTGALIPLSSRIGILDRKIRVINENVSSHRTWNEWVYRAYESIYGYEYQGDNLLIARINMLETFCEYTRQRWGKEPSEYSLKRIARIISWNIWQMDGIYGIIPTSEPLCDDKDELTRNQMDFLSNLFPDDKPIKTTIDSVLFDWEAKEIIKYKELRKERKNEV